MPTLLRPRAWSTCSTSSVGSADKSTGIPHSESKYKVEQHIATLGIPYTIIRPVYFFENVFNPFVLPSLKAGKLAKAMPVDRMLQQISVQNIVAFVALAPETRERFLGKSIDIASDELTGEQAAKIVSEASGRTIEYVQTPLEQARAMNEDFALNVEWMTNVGYSAAIAGLRKQHPQVGWKTFAEWARRQDWTVLGSSNERIA